MTHDGLFAEINHLVWDREYFGNSLIRWAIAAATFVVVLVILQLLKSFLERRTRAMAESRPTPAWQAAPRVVAATRTWFLVITALYLGSLGLTLPPKIATSLRIGEIIALLLQGALWSNAAISTFTQHWVRNRLEHDPASAPFTLLAGYAVRVALWTVVLLLCLENLGIEVTALLTGLGIGGIAIALAVQNILGDLFASLSIVVDKPFVIGDFIIVDDLMGTVENIGLKTTRVRSLGGEQLIFPNSNLLQSRVRNFKRMEERRVLFKIGLTYDTPVDKLAALPKMIREIVESQSPVRFDRAHFLGFGASSLDFEIVYFVLSRDFNLYADIQQAINLELLRRCNGDGIGFAFPTQTVYVQRIGRDANDGAANGSSKTSDPAAS